ncbi:hypothetical protein B9G55_13220 [Saccharibacillus sp. O16]|nr:hypothetical protein B9G55_13220 [Saccharibacillus sp. O16]
MKSAFFAQNDVFFEDDDSKDLENIIESKGEGLNIEYKKDNANDKNDNILKTICAFANTEGGSIYLGIDDDGNFIGIENTDAESQKILNAFDDRIEGHVLIKPYIHECRLISGTAGRILEIEVQESDNKPIALRKDHKLSYYKRIGASNRVMRPSDLNYLIQVEARKMSFDRVGLSNQNLL